MQYASQNLIPVTLELGGKSPNIFFDDIASEKDAYYSKALEGFTMFALNQGEVCTCPSRALMQDGIYDSFLADRGGAHQGWSSRATHWTPTPMIGAQASNDQLEKILSYLDIGKQEGAKVLTGGGRADLGGDLSGGYYVQPTIFEGNNTMRIFQEEIFGPVVSVTRFKDYDDAISIANDTLYGLGAGVWTRNGRTGLPRRPRHPGRARVGEQLPRLPGPLRLRRVQVLRHRPREPPDDARPLPADEEPLGLLHGDRAGLLLIPSRGGERRLSSERSPLPRGRPGGDRRRVVTSRRQTAF
jgi:acyl-CoA reductase-like NAD-dependent aldehyde dehydrogenase